jgi:hypothetical protein
MYSGQFGGNVVSGLPDDVYCIKCGWVVLSTRQLQTARVRATCQQSTGKGTILPPISGPVSLKPIPATWYTFFEAPESCRETLAPGNLAQ